MFKRSAQHRHSLLFGHKQNLAYSLCTDSFFALIIAHNKQNVIYVGMMYMKRGMASGWEAGGKLQSNYKQTLTDSKGPQRQRKTTEIMQNNNKEAQGVHSEMQNNYKEMQYDYKET